MTETTPPSPQILPQVETTPEIESTSALAPMPVKPRKNILIIIIVVVVIVLLILLAASVKTTTSEPSGSTARTSSTPTPTGVAVSTRALTTFATESAFLKFETTAEGLPKLISGAVLQDPTILPPVLDLPLGF